MDAATTPTKQITRFALRLDADTYAECAEIAYQQRRSLNNLINVAMRELADKEKVAAASKGQDHA
jgi:hypothetical protein